MKSIITKIALAATVATLALSCQKFFDEKPVNTTTPDDFFNSELALETYANGLLEQQLPSASTLTRGDQISDISVTTQTENYLKVGGYNAQSATNWSRSNWLPLFRINYFLVHMKDAKGLVEDAVYNHYEGVGRFWRAWFYWSKVKTFGDVPWYDTPIDPDDDEALYKGRDPRNEVMAHVLEDLNFAVENCSVASKYLRDANVINGYCALALKTRICLYEGTYRKYHELEGAEQWLEECVAAAKELMASGAFHLINTTGKEATNYSTLFKSADLQYDEVILGNQYSQEFNRLHDASWYFASGSAGQRTSATRQFVNMYLNTDGSRFTDRADYNKVGFKDEFVGRDYRLRQTIITPYYEKKVNGELTNEFSKVFPGLGAQLTYYRIIKWNLDDDATESATQSWNSLPVFRYAEILLSYAEAAAELGQMTSEVWDATIRPLRERSGVNGKEPTTADPYLAAYYCDAEGNPTITDKWILECRRERAIELYLENVRRDDLFRWKMGHLFTVPFEGIYIPEVGKAFDMNGDAKNDICFYSKSHPKPAKSESGVTYVEITENEGDNITTYARSADGNLIYVLDREWDDHKYLYPVPKNAIDINQNLLPQNPGWDY